MNMKKAIMLSVSSSKWYFPKNVLIETDSKGGELLDDIANQSFEKYKQRQNIDDLQLISYVYYGNVEIHR